MRIEPNPYQWDRVNLRLFYGRQSLADELCRGTQEGHSYAVVGGRRMGKTTLLRRIEADLMECRCQLAGLMVLPVYVDILGLPHPLTPCAIYREIVISIDRSLRRFVQLPASRQPLHTSLDLWPGEENRAFRDAIQAVVQTCGDRYLQIVMLIDEIEPIVQNEWGQGFFNNWRQFLSNDPGVTEHVTAIFSGAREMEFIAHDIGSPLSNVLTWKELTLFADAEATALINEPTCDCLPSTVVEYALSLTGGHPFLIQYLMHRVCESDLEEAEAQLQYAAEQFLHEQDNQFRSWWFDKFNSADRMVYALLAHSEGSISRKELISQVGDVPADQTLRTLSHTGVIRRAIDETESYQVAGSLFEQWFLLHGALTFEHSNHDPTLTGFHDCRTPDGKINMRTLLANFRDCIGRAGYRILEASERPREFVGQDLLFTYLDMFVQQIRGVMYREVPTGRGRMDLIIVHEGDKYIVETKLWEGEQRYQKGKHQLAKYLQCERVSEGYYVVFDHRSKPQEHTEEEEIEECVIVSHIIPVVQERPSARPVPDY